MKPTQNWRSSPCHYYRYGANPAHTRPENSTTILVHATSVSAHDYTKSFIAYAPLTKNNSTRVKPMNILYVDRPHDVPTILTFIRSLSWQTDLRTINLDEYPELFV